jgi:hypothetical protein
MKTTFLILSIFGIVFSTLNCMELDSHVEDGTSFSFETHYSPVDLILNLSNLEITETSFNTMFADLLCFINSHKVTSLLLDSNKFSLESFKEIFKKSAGLLRGCPTLMTISLKNNFKSATVEKGFTLSPLAVTQLISMIGQLGDLFETSATAANQQVITKQIIFDDDLPTVGIPVSLPPTYCQRIKKFTWTFIGGAVTIVLSVGSTVLGLYLSGKFTCPECPSSN